MKPDVSAFFHAPTGSYAYVVADPSTRKAVVIDPVLDFDVKSARTQTLFADALIAQIHDQQLEVLWIVETHAHADHLSAGAYLRDMLSAALGIGAGIVEVQRHFGEVCGLGAEFKPDGSDFDRLFTDGDRLAIGELELRVMATPGHTPDGVSYVIGDSVFVGDTLFAPDVGTARCDFPGGDAQALYRSIRRILELPAATRVFLCHDYPPPERQPRAQTTVAAERERNVHLAGRDEAAFVELRRARDATLAAPTLLWPAIQVNIRGGRLPPPDSNGRAYLKLPLNAL